MDRDGFVKIVDKKLKLIRNENNYTQDKMSEVIGISKKKLIQIEKERSSLGWSGAVTLCTIFRDSQVLQIAFGGQPLDIILILAFDGYNKNYEKTLGGKVWWNDIEKKGEFKIQQNIISKHYRVLDSEERRITSSFDFEYIQRRFKELNLQKGVSK